MKRFLLFIFSLVICSIPYPVYADVGPHFDESNGYIHTDSAYCYGDYYRGQQFITGDNPFIVRSISLYRKLGEGYPSNVIVSIYDIREKGHPTGKSLTTSGEVDCSNWNNNFEWHMFDVPHYELASNKKYAIIVEADKCDSNNFIRLSFTRDSDYEGGSVVRSVDKGF